MTTSEIITAVGAFAFLVGTVANIVIGVRSLRLNREAWRLNHEARSSPFKQFIYEKQYDIYLAALDWMNQWEKRRFQIDPNDKERLKELGEEELDEMNRHIWTWTVLLPNNVSDALLTYLCCLQNLAGPADFLWLEGKKDAFQNAVRMHLGIDPIMEDVSEILKTPYHLNEIARREKIKADPVYQAFRKAFAESKKSGSKHSRT